MDNTNVKRNDEGKRRKRKNEGINRRKDTLIKKAYELGELDSIDVALIICKHGRYTTYKSRDYASWPPFITEIVSKSDCLLEIHNRC
jgi:putative salt-induced outer membrane protein YdiY